MLFGKDHGWQALKEDISTFCKLLRFKPNQQQMHHLLRVQNSGVFGCRLGLSQLTADQSFHVIALSTLFRAFVHDAPSYLFHENRAHARKWIDSMALLGSQAIEPLRSQLQVSTQRRFLQTSSGIHIAHLVGPFQKKDGGLRAGHQDIILPDFDKTPTPRIQRAIELSKNHILYVHGTLVEPANGAEAPDRRRDNSSS